MKKLTTLSIFLISLFTVFEFQARAQTPPPAAAQKTDKPALNAEKLAMDFTDKMAELSHWYITMDGKEDGVQEVVNHVMEMFAPDIVAEVPPHDEKQLGPVQLVGLAQFRKWAEEIARNHMEIHYTIKRQTVKEFEGEYMIFSKQLPWGGLGVAFQVIESDSQRVDRKRFMQNGGVFLQFNPDGKINRMRLVLAEKDEVVEGGGYGG